MAKTKFRFYHDNDKTDLEMDELKGPVRQMMQTIYKAYGKGGVVFPGKIEVGYGDDDNGISTYDEKGLRIQHISFNAAGYKINNYAKRNLLVETLQYGRDKQLTSRQVYKYRKDDKPEEFFYYDKEGNLVHYYIFKYDSQNREVEQRQFLGKEKVPYDWHERKYNEFGNQLSYIRYNADGSMNYSSVSTYNEKGHLLETVNKYGDEKMHTSNDRIVYRPNQYGDSIETTFHKGDGTIKTYYSDYEYDSEGKRIIPPRKEDEKSEAETELIENDAQGNWIKKTTFYNKIPVNIFVREISYFGEPEKTFTHPLMTTTDVAQSEEPRYEQEELEAGDAKWLVEGKETGADQFPLMKYYAMTFNEFPSLVSYTGPYIEANKLLEELKEEQGARELHTYQTNYDRRGNQLIRYTLTFPDHEGYLLHANHISAHDAEEYDVPDSIDDSEGYVYISQVSFFCPGEYSGKRDEYFEEEIEEYIGKCSLKKKPDKPVINIIVANANGFVMSEHPVDNNFKIDDLDVNYGSGFDKFHNDLVHRFNTTTKGLVLFHGQPGTGKTYYIRHLLRNMVSNKKVVIYMPPNMVDHLVEPGFMTFLSGEVQGFSEDGLTCVLLIEDAEPLLAKRQEGVRIQGITNLLNMSDGLLNDMLNLQIICTFNVDLRKLDSALLRPGRLIARKEFKALPELDANLLAQRLGIKHHFRGPATLGEIYAMRKNKDTLIHDVESDKGASTLLDDLL